MRPFLPEDAADSGGSDAGGTAVADGFSGVACFLLLPASFAADFLLTAAVGGGGVEAAAGIPAALRETRLAGLTTCRFW